MRQRGPYVLIGILIGIIVMQWAMPVAHGQSDTIEWRIRAQRIELVDDFGKTQITLDANNVHFQLGAFFPLGRPNISMRVNDLDGSQMIMYGHSGTRVTLQASEDATQIVMTGNENTEGSKYLEGRNGFYMFGNDDPFNSVEIKVRPDGGHVRTFQSRYGPLPKDELLPSGPLDIETGSLPLNQLLGDLNFDNTVDLSDFFIFSDNFGNSR